MCPLRRIEDHRAGASALGILVPPGRRTFLILRPRSLSWDLLLLRSDPTGDFREMPPHEANALALELYQRLGGAPDEVRGRIEEIAAADGTRFQISIHAGPFALRVCQRRPGQPYQPLLSPDREAARIAVERLLAVLRPPEGIEQEVYLNTRHFTR
jgi:hypothetical protein